MSDIIYNEYNTFYSTKIFNQYIFNLLLSSVSDFSEKCSLYKKKLLFLRIQMKVK